MNTDEDINVPVKTTTRAFIQSSARYLSYVGALILVIILYLNFPIKDMFADRNRNITSVTVETDTVKAARKFKEQWKDLDSRPLPEWYDRAKIGIFLHWSVFSIPEEGLSTEELWTKWDEGSKSYMDIVTKNFRSRKRYRDFVDMFRAEFFDPNEWAMLFKKSGAKYVILTSKNHDGFTLFPSKRSFSWNSIDMGPHRDLVGDLAASVKTEGLKFGLYYSLYEWLHPLFMNDKDSGFTTQSYVDMKMMPEIMQLVTDYEPAVVWADGDQHGKSEYWNSTHFLAWLYNDSPVKDDVVVNDRWGKGTWCTHGDFYNCEDKFYPRGLQDHKWENIFSVDRFSWGYRRDMDFMSVLSMEEILYSIVMTVSCGGNALINIGPTKDGTISPIFEDRLLELGHWLDVNGEAIYGTSPWHYQKDTINEHTWYTCKKLEYDALNSTAVPKENDTILAIYAIFLKWPKNDRLRLMDIVFAYRNNSLWNIQMLGVRKYLKWNITNEDIHIQLPAKQTVASDYAWVLEFTPKKPSNELSEIEDKESFNYFFF